MASEPVFADSAFFCALAAKRDAAHVAALAALDLLADDNRLIVTTDYIVDEALTLTKARANAAVALALLERIERSPAIILELVSGPRFGAAKAFFRKHADHGYSFTDCTSFVVMRELGLSEALTTDRHFREAGFKPLQTKSCS
jgi:predicted nucleic acid-binding protein